METQFKNILAIIDRAAESTDTAATLFQDPANITYEDKQAFEEWSGKSFGCIKEIISTAYGKRQITFNPFAGAYSPATALPVFSKFDEESKPDISYGVENTLYGPIIIASTHTGICYRVFFRGDEAKVPEILAKEFPGSAIFKEKVAHHNAALAYLNGENHNMVQLHVKGTLAKMLVWEALTNVPCGKLISYGTLAKATGHMAQDIGAAMGDNRIAMLIPCHRVIKATGELGHYHWGAKRKRAMIIKEAIVL
jgi:O-6-methylguanine DNA methyltransferase